jgi:hypothetical protein
VEQSAGGWCEIVKQTGRRSLALLRLGVVGDKGEGSARGAVSETGWAGTWPAGVLTLAPPWGNVDQWASSNLGGPLVSSGPAR